MVSQYVVDSNYEASNSLWMRSYTLHKVLHGKNRSRANKDSEMDLSSEQNCFQLWNTRRTGLVHFKRRNYEKKTTLLGKDMKTSKKQVGEKSFQRNVGKTVYPQLDRAYLRSKADIQHLVVNTIPRQLQKYHNTKMEIVGKYKMERTKRKGKYTQILPQTKAQRQSLVPLTGQNVTSTYYVSNYRPTSDKNRKRQTLCYVQL